MAGYDRVNARFEQNGCKLLTTFEEWKHIRTMTNRKYKYIASCGHEHEVFYNVFCSRGTGIICPECQTAKQSKISKEKAVEKPIAFLEQEKDCIDYLIDLCASSFICKKLFDGCKADVALKPIDVEADEWIGLQFKTTKSMYKDNYYSFHLRKSYENLYIICMSLEDKKMWMIPYEEVSGKIKISIGSTTSKYSMFEVNDVDSDIKEFYEKGKKFTFDELNTPQNIYQQREQEFRKYREQKLQFLNFIYPELEGTVFDFKINDLKVQEKIGRLRTERNTTAAHFFQLSKSAGSAKGKTYSHKRCYQKHDNDFYWLNCPNKEIFYVIPEKELIDREIVDRSDSQYQMFYINTDDSQSWYNDYKFSYSNPDKPKLMKIFKCV